MLVSSRSSRTATSRSRRECESIWTSSRKSFWRRSRLTAAISDCLASECGALERGGEHPMLFAQRARQRVADAIEKFTGRGELGTPFAGVYREGVAQSVAGNVETGQVETDRSLVGGRRAVGAVEQPLEHAQIFAITGPQEVAAGVFAEPVDHEDARRTLELLADDQPMREVVADVVAAERQHRHRIAPQNADFAGGGSGG